MKDSWFFVLLVKKKKKCSFSPWLASNFFFSVCSPVFFSAAAASYNFFLCNFLLLHLCLCHRLLPSDSLSSKISLPSTSLFLVVFIIIIFPSRRSPPSTERSSGRYIFFLTSFEDSYIKTLPSSLLIITFLSSCRTKQWLLILKWLLSFSPLQIIIKSQQQIFQRILTDLKDQRLLSLLNTKSCESMSRLSVLMLFLFLSWCSNSAKSISIISWQYHYFLCRRSLLVRRRHPLYHHHYMTFWLYLSYKSDKWWIP